MKLLIKKKQDDVLGKIHDFANWSQFCEFLNNNKTFVKDKSEGIQVFAGETSGDSKKTSFLNISIFCLDLDKENNEEGISSQTFEKIKDILRKENLNYYLFTTFSHPQVISQNRFKVRIFIPFEQPLIDFESFRAVAGYYIKKFLNVGDINSLKYSQGQHAVRIKEGEEGSHFQTWFTEGKGLQAQVEQNKKETPKIKLQTDESDITAEELNFLIIEEKNKPTTHDGALLVEKALKGENFAEKGERQNKIVKIASFLALRVNKNKNLRNLKVFFKDAYSKINQNNQDIKTIKDLLLLVDDFRKKQLSLVKDNDPLLEILKENVEFKNEPNHNCWFLQYGNNTYFVLTKEGYVKKSKETLILFAYRILKENGLEYRKVDSKGEIKNMEYVDVMRTYGQEVFQIKYDLTAKKTSYNEKENSLVIAPCPIRYEEGDEEYNPVINKWLFLFTGDNKIFSKLVFWLIFLTDLKQLLTALILEGDHGCGKSLLARLCASFWSNEKNGATDLKRYFNRFNEDIMTNPVLLADEGIDEDLDAMQIRKLLQESKHDIDVKFKDKVNLIGTMRMIISCHDYEKLGLGNKGNDNLASIDGTQQRFLHIQVKHEAQNYLSTVRKDIDSWWQEGKFAKHVLFLKKALMSEVLAESYNCKITCYERLKSERFIIPMSGDSALRQQEKLFSRTYGNLLQWLVRWIKDPIKLIEYNPTISQTTSVIPVDIYQFIEYICVTEYKEGGEIQIGISTDQIFDKYWTAYCDIKQKPYPTKIKDFIKNITAKYENTNKNKRLNRVYSFNNKGKIEKRKYLYNMIDLRFLISYSIEHDYFEDEPSFREELKKLKDKYDSSSSMKGSFHAI